MGFRQNTYCTVWEVRPKSDTRTTLRISISRKNRNTDQYEQDFAGFVDCYGSACAKKAASLREKDRIRLGDVDVCNSYDKESGKTFTFFKVFSFSAEGESGNSGARAATSVDDGEPEVDDEDDLPF